jgi:hypothetical protein
MNTSTISEWPKWYGTDCPKCGEWVPAGHKHYCDHREDAPPVRSVSAHDGNVIVEKRVPEEKDAE